MPIFRYKCADCTRPFDHLQMRGDDDPSVCEHCGSQNIARALTTAAVKMGGIRAQAMHDFMMDKARGGTPQDVIHALNTFDETGKME